MKQLLTNCRVFDGERVHKNRAVVLQGEHIAEIASAGTPLGDADVEIDLDGQLLAPGLIDLQVNGGGGQLFNDAPNLESIRTIASAHRRAGTTGILPTLISDGQAKTSAAIAAVEKAVSQQVPGILGLHLEGPHLSAARHGIHDPDRLRRFSDANLRELRRARVGRLLLTVAPETLPPGSIRSLVADGILVFGGHSDASYEDCLKALDEGLCGFTHLYNAMSGFESRAPGMVGAALDDPGSVVSLIADGHHLHPASLRIAIKSKPAGKSLLVSDAMSSVGSDATRFNLFGQDIKLINGRLENANGTLAGAHLCLIEAVRYVAANGGVDIFEALRMASLYPARVLGLDDQLGAIRPGYRASIIALDDEFNVRRTWVDGAADEAR